MAEHEDHSVRVVTVGETSVIGVNLQQTDLPEEGADKRAMNAIQRASNLLVEGNDRSVRSPYVQAAIDEGTPRGKRLVFLGDRIDHEELGLHRRVPTQTVVASRGWADAVEASEKVGTDLPGAHRTIELAAALLSPDFPKMARSELKGRLRDVTAGVGESVRANTFDQVSQGESAVRAYMQQVELADVTVPGAVAHELVSSSSTAVVVDRAHVSAVTRGLTGRDVPRPQSWPTYQESLAPKERDAIRAFELTTRSLGRNLRAR